jgi:hypothetical protein
MTLFSCQIWIKEGSRKGRYALGETLKDATLISFSVSYMMNKVNPTASLRYSDRRACSACLPCLPQAGVDPEHAIILF